MTTMMQRIRRRRELDRQARAVERAIRQAPASDSMRNELIAMASRWR